ncbi:MAG: phasin family protein [Rivularia sp. ALOHA_DT_140]|nr:phasin family protein [Rivularia sp. ALOHA_DT_140]
MPGFGDIAKRAFYLGVGLAAYAGEKAGGTLAELRSQAQKLADEMVAKGEMSAEEARKFVEDMMKQAQVGSSESSETATRTEPRRIEILGDDEEPVKETSEPQDVDRLRDQVKRMQDELRRLQRDK